MNNKWFIGTLLVCAIVITVQVVEFFINKKELQTLKIEKTQLSIELLKLQQRKVKQNKATH